MNGYEACAAIRKMFPLSAVPIIMVSAKSREENVIQARAVLPRLFLAHLYVLCYSCISASHFTYCARRFKAHSSLYPK